jgi:hypothetical protein
MHLVRRRNGRLTPPDKVRHRLSRIRERRIVLHAVLGVLAGTYAIPLPAQQRNPACITSPRDKVPGDRLFASAEERNTAEERNVLFHVEVTGNRQGGDDTMPSLGKALPILGKAFPIGQNLVVTSRHVVGTDREWKEKEDRNREIKRATQILDRNISLWYLNATNGKMSDQIDKNLVVPAPSQVSDAVGILLPDDERLSKYYCLSMCAIDKAKNSYRAILTSADPSDRASVKELVSVPLTPRGYDPKAFGSLYVFDVANNNFNFEGNPTNGHDGSPILDGENQVVALVSAVTRPPQSGWKLLATPIGPFFPGASDILLSRGIDVQQGGSLNFSCSLADAVERIQYQFSGRLIWTLHEERDKDKGGSLTNLILSYESVSETPNIDEFQVQYRFYGRQHGPEPETQITYAGDHDNKFDIHLVEGKQKYDISQVIKKGKEAEKEVKTVVSRSDMSPGNITRGEIIIIPHFQDGRRLSRAAIVRKEFEWP